jgi:hypothetical protein
MPEIMPEPTLDIFGDEVVPYEQMLSPEERGDQRLSTEKRTVRVDEIDSLPDERLRSALWNRYRVQTDPSARQVVLVTTHPDGTYSRTVSVPKGSLGLPSSEAEARTTVEPVPPCEPVRRRFFSRIFGQ